VLHIFARITICVYMEKIKLVYGRRKRKNGKGLVELEIYFSRGERKYISTKVELLPGEWDGYVVNRSDSLSLNKYLSEFKKNYEKTFKNMTIDGIASTMENLNEYIKPEEEKYPDFLSLMEDMITKSAIRESTRKQHFVAYSALRDFGKIKSFASLTPRNILLFDDYLRKDNREQTTIYGYHKRIKVYVIKAYQMGYIESNPYRMVKIDRGTYKERKPLIQDEINLLINTNFNSLLDKVRDMFIFQIYTGIAYADLEAFDFKKEVVKSGSLYFIDSKRVKTGSNFYTPILPPAMKILEKYDYKLPVMSNQKYNLYLHAIENILGINKPLTSHVARHTFATTVALAHDVPIETVSKMLGHKDIKTTQIYAKVLKSTIERNVFEKMM